MKLAPTKKEKKVIKLKIDKNAFWSTADTGKGIKYVFEAYLTVKFLRKEGFRSYNGNIIQLKNNIAAILSPEEVYQYCFRYIENFDRSELTNEFIKQGKNLLLKDKAVLLGLNECEKDFIKDTLTKSYHFYKNGVVVVEKDKELLMQNYKELDGIIWKENIIDRDFDLNIDEESMYEKLVKNISGGNISHTNSICSAIGYLLAGYKDSRNPKSIIINDCNYENDGKAEGGTGKGLLVKSISQLKNVVIKNGKNSRMTDNSFALQEITPLTQILCIDDVNRNFDFESVYSITTEDMSIEKKRKDPYVIKAKDSPKLVITSNYTIKGNTASDRRRRFDIYLTNHYNDKWTPKDDFKQEFFYDWDDTEWKRFDMYMMKCLKMFLEKGLIEYENDDLKLKKLYRETNQAFVEVMEEDFTKENEFYLYTFVRTKVAIAGGKKLENYLEGNNKIIVDWIKLYAGYKGSKLITKTNEGKPLRTGAGNGFKWEGCPNEDEEFPF